MLLLVLATGDEVKIHEPSHGTLIFFHDRELSTRAHPDDIHTYRTPAKNPVNYTGSNATPVAG